MGRLGRDTGPILRPLTAIAALALPHTGAAADPVPIGVERQVNVDPTDRQGAPSVAMGADGGFVVVWASDVEVPFPFEEDPDGSRVEARRYASTGQPVGPQILVRPTVVPGPREPDVAIGTTGEFVVAWSELPFAGAGGGYGTALARGFDASGAALGPAFELSPEVGAGGSPAVEPRAGGDFVVALELARGCYPSLCFSGPAFAFASATQLTTGPLLAAESATASTVAAVERPGGEIVVLARGGWDFLGELGPIAGRRFDAAGDPLGPSFQIAPGPTATLYGDLDGLDVRAGVRDDGAFLVVWADEELARADTSGKRIRARGYDAAGDPVGAVFEVNGYTTFDQRAPDAIALPDASFLVTWDSQGSDGGDVSSRSVRARRVALDGTALGSEMQLNTLTMQAQALPRLATDGDGSIVAVWQSDVSAGGDDDHSSIQLLRLATNAVFVDGFESGDLGAWDEPMETAR